MKKINKFDWRATCRFRDATSPARPHGISGHCRSQRLCKFHFSCNCHYSTIIILIVGPYSKTAVLLLTTFWCLHNQLISSRVFLLTRMSRTGQGWDRSVGWRWVRMPCYKLAEVRIVRVSSWQPLQRKLLPVTQIRWESS